MGVYYSLIYLLNVKKTINKINKNNKKNNIYNKICLNV